MMGDVQSCEMADVVDLFCGAYFVEGRVASALSVCV